MAFYHKKKTGAKPERDAQGEILDALLDKMEKGTNPFVHPIDRINIGPARRFNGEPYNGINAFFLTMKAYDEGRTSPFYMTFDQAKKLGAQVKKGAKGLPVVYCGFTEKEKENAKGEKEIKRIPFQKYSTVFNAEQIDGLPDEYYPKPKHLTPEEIEARRKAVDPNIMKAMQEMTAGLKLRGGYKEQGQEAFYSPSDDSITMPTIDRFKSFWAYADTRAHEMAHATETEDRLNAGFKRKAFGDSEYAKGERFAQSTATLIAGELGYAPETIDNSAAYLRGWAKEGKEDKAGFLKLINLATKAKDYLLEHTSDYNKEKRNARYAEGFEEQAAKGAYTPKEAPAKATVPANTPEQITAAKAKVSNAMPTIFGGQDTSAKDIADKQGEAWKTHTMPPKEAAGKQWLARNSAPTL